MRFRQPGICFVSIKKNSERKKNLGNSNQIPGSGNDHILGLNPTRNPYQQQKLILLIINYFL